MNHEKKLTSTAKFWFVFIGTFIVLLLLCAIVDALIAGIVFLIFFAFGSEFAPEIFKWFIIIFVAIQGVLFTPFVFESVKTNLEKEEK